MNSSASAPPALTGSVPTDRRLLFLAGNAAIDRTFEVEQVIAGSIHRPGTVLALPGGKGINAARAAHTLGANVTVVAVIAGHNGAWIAQHLASEGIDRRLVPASGETRICTSVFDRSDGRLTEFYETGMATEQSAWDEVLEVVDGEIKDADLGAIICSGSVPPGSRNDLYAQVVRLGNGHRVPVFVDAAGPLLLEALNEHPAVVKVNREEALTVSGVGDVNDRAAFDAANWLAAHGAVRAVVTLGVNGAIGVDRDSRTTFQVEPVANPGRYSVGSGDAFMAGLALSTVMQEPFAEGLSLGMAAAIANASVQGAGRFDPDEMERLRPGVRVRQVAAAGPMD